MMVVRVWFGPPLRTRSNARALECMLLIKSGFRDGFYTAQHNYSYNIVLYMCNLRLDLAPARPLVVEMVNNVQYIYRNIDLKLWEGSEQLKQRTTTTRTRTARKPHS